ncbi:glutathione S-transferase [Photobacterium sanctipauli]|uniref:Glutathione S-transferase n=1 Tax=Photobacterium sanctipauli TaxID=1342794 RepID=A0A2T3P006_9GAMM|nr:glutathione S-transferase [Photobacterium sanctipauli]PSW21855.1 glutathione S-transferase [Photobacterium sanctipauli]
MKIYELAPTPSAKRVSFFLAEKGIEVERESVNVREGENLTEAFQSLSVNGRIPVLALDDGTTICESIAICRYFEELYPEKAPLFGATALEKAQVEMWQRIVELQGLFVAFQAFRNITAIYSDRETCIEAWGHESRQRVIDFLPTLEKQLAEQPYVAGEHFSVADITAFVLMGMLAALEVAIDEYPNMQAWKTRIAERPAIQSIA